VSGARYQVSGSGAGTGQESEPTGRKMAFVGGLWSRDLSVEI